MDDNWVWLINHTQLSIDISGDHTQLQLLIGDNCV